MVVRLPVIAHRLAAHLEAVERHQACQARVATHLAAEVPNQAHRPHWATHLAVEALKQDRLAAHQSAKNQLETGLQFPQPQGARQQDPY